MYRLGAIHNITDGDLRTQHCSISATIITNIRDDVFSLQFSDGFTMSWHELNAIVLYLAIRKLAFLYSCIFVFLLQLYMFMYDYILIKQI